MNKPLKTLVDDTCAENGALLSVTPIWRIIQQQEVLLYR